LTLWVNKLNFKNFWTQLLNFKMAVLVTQFILFGTYCIDELAEKNGFIF